jgi:hypothetical protein
LAASAAFSSAILRDVLLVFFFTGFAFGFPFFSDLLFREGFSFLSFPFMLRNGPVNRLLLVFFRFIKSAVVCPPFEMVGR